MTRPLPDAALALFLNDEDFRADAYRDSGGVLTIGWGHTRDVHEGQHVTYHDAVFMLRTDLGEVADAIDRLIHVPLTDNQYAALCSFVFNVGAHALATSTLCADLNAGHYDAVPDELRRWVHDRQGRVLAGLATRRAQEVALWNDGVRGAPIPFSQSFSRS